jgi:WD40-like Beta Propeller Repeat
MRRSIAYLVLTATMLLGVVAFTPSVEAKAPGPNGRIVFGECVVHSSECENFVASTVNPDGSSLEQLPASASFTPYARWSPDGSEIAITEPKTSTPECPGGAICPAVVVNPDTGTYHGVPWPAPGDWDVDCYPWSPDGTRLACGAADNTDPSQTGVYTIRASDGGSLTKIVAVTNVDEGIALGDFSPDGTRIVFTADPDGEVGTFVVGVDGNGLHPITPPGMLLNNSDGGSWSPTGDQIVFQARSAPDQRYSVWVVGADGSGLHQVPIPRCGGAVTDPRSAACRLPSWSPDGTKIVFSKRTPSARTTSAGIYTVNADGSGLRLVANSGLGATAPDWGSHPIAS